MIYANVYDKKDEGLPLIKIPGESISWVYEPLQMVLSDPTIQTYPCLHLIIYDPDAEIRLLDIESDGKSVYQALIKAYYEGIKGDPPLRDYLSAKDLMEVLYG